MARDAAPATDLLKQDELHNSSALDILRRVAKCELRCAPAEGPRAVAVSGYGTSEWHIAAYALRPLKELVRELPSQGFTCYVHQAWILDILQHRYALGSRASFMKMTASQAQFRPTHDPAVTRLGREHLGALKASKLFDEIAERIHTGKSTSLSLPRSIGGKAWAWPLARPPASSSLSRGVFRSTQHSHRIPPRCLWLNGWGSGALAL